MVHVVSPGPYGFTHHNSNLHLTTQHGRTVLNAEELNFGHLHLSVRCGRLRRSSPHVSRTSQSHGNSLVTDKKLRVAVQRCRGSDYRKCAGSRALWNRRANEGIFQNLKLR
jgi:hypothetical protein